MVYWDSNSSYGGSIMPDITMCRIEVCSKAGTCLRHTAKPSQRMQSYLASPEKDCREKDYTLYTKDDTK